MVQSNRGWESIIIVRSSVVVAIERQQATTKIMEREVAEFASTSYCTVRSLRVEVFLSFSLGLMVHIRMVAMTLGHIQEVQKDSLCCRVIRSNLSTNCALLLLFVYHIEYLRSTETFDDDVERSRSSPLVKLPQARGASEASEQATMEGRQGATTSIEEPFLLLFASDERDACA